MADNKDIKIFLVKSQQDFKQLRERNEVINNSIYKVDLGDGTHEEYVVDDKGIINKLNDGLKLQDIVDTVGIGGLRMEVVSTAGNIAWTDDFETDLVATVFKIFKNVTENVNKFTWTRWSGDTEQQRNSDILWNMRHKNENSYLIHITNEDITKNVARFTCEAEIDNTKITQTIQI